MLLSITSDPTIGSSCNFSRRFQRCLSMNIGVYFQENPCSERTCNIGLNRLYKFCFLFSFDLWTFYLAKILFLQRCSSLFWEFSSSTRIFNELQYNFQVWQGFINVLKSFSYKDSLFILATQGKKGWWFLMTS